VMDLVQSWFSDWSAAPVCYVDLPIVGQEEIYTGAKLEQGMKCWLDVVAKHRIPVVLFDTAEKAKGRHLMKDSPSDPAGILREEQIHGIDRYASGLGIKALWAGGITLRQTLALGMLKVFGIYVTSAAAAKRPIKRSAGRDPSLAAEKRITYAGVRNAKLLLEVGFLITRLRELAQTTSARVLEQTALRLVKEAEAMPRADSRIRRKLHKLAVNAWVEHFKQTGQNRKSGTRPNTSTEPS